MNKKLRSTLLWIFSILFTISIAYYQRKTGPTYPVDGIIKIKNASIEYKLVRSHGGAGDAMVKIQAPQGFKGRFKYKRYKSYDDWQTVPMKREDSLLVAAIPHQPPAGKVMYYIYVGKSGHYESLTQNPVIIRFKGDVPAGALIPHVILMFLAMLMSTRTGLEALFKSSKTKRYTFLTLVFLFFGGLIFGPIVQKYAFDAYWTGWPVGNDLTDNKTIVAFIFWLIAFFRMNKTKKAYGWVIAAAIILLIVYLVPHSVLGSEIDYTQVNAQ